MKHSGYILGGGPYGHIETLVAIFFLIFILILFSIIKNSELLGFSEFGEADERVNSILHLNGKEVISKSRRKKQQHKLEHLSLILE